MSFPSQPNEFDKSLIFDFFWKFSMFECALKREGFLIKGKHKAEPNWKDFAEDIRCAFDGVQLVGFKEAVAKLQKLSPKRQIVNKKEELDWEPVKRKDGISEAEYTLDLLKVVRNNLFHGGKYAGYPISEVGRDCEILRAASTILDGCYELHTRVKHRIDEAAA